MEPGSSIDRIIASVPVIPVLTIKRRSDAVPLARALVAGGLSVLEITLRTEVALDSARAIAAAVPEAVVGLGTILGPDDVARARSVGARFGVSPGLTPQLAAAVSNGDLAFL